jgi:hypothetical protein
VPLFKQRFDFSLDSRCRCCCCSDPCSPVALGVALPRLLLLPDLLRSAVFSCWCRVKALSQLFCSVCSDLTVCDALGLFGSKESFMPAMICHRGLWYVNFVRVGGQFIRRFTPQQMQTHHFLLFGFVPVRGFAG